MLGGFALKLRTTKFGAPGMSVGGGGMVGGITCVGSGFAVGTAVGSAIVSVGWGDEGHGTVCLPCSLTVTKYCPTAKVPGTAALSVVSLTNVVDRGSATPNNFTTVFWVKLEPVTSRIALWPFTIRGGLTVHI